MPEPTRQYVSVQFRPGDQRSYTYHNDGEPVAVGDRVTVSTVKGDQPVTVSEVSTEPPSFPTKPILGPPQADPAA